MAKEEGMVESKEMEIERLEKIVDQITGERREGSVNDLQGQINYLDHVASNPTKSMDEALAEVYKTIDKLGGYVTHGALEKDLNEIRNIIEIVMERGIANGMTKTLLELMTGKVSEKIAKKEIPDNHGILIVLSPDMKKSLVTVIPLYN